MGESTSSPVYTKISRGISSSTSRAFSLDRNSWLVMGGWHGFLGNRCLRGGGDGGGDGFLWRGRGGLGLRGLTAAAAEQSEKHCQGQKQGRIRLVFISVSLLF